MKDYNIDSCLWHPEIKCELSLYGICDCHLCIPNLCEVPKVPEIKEKVLEVVAYG